jgi:hypothetical protein
MNKNHRSKSEKGQTWIIMAVAITALIILMGFAIDSAILFSNYTKLKRAVDAAAVAAANQYKVKNGKLTETSTFDVDLLRTKMTEAANEMLVMHELDLTNINLHLYLCGDPNLQTLVPDFWAKCPEGTGGAPRKLVYIQASEEAPTYFLHLIGINSIPITTNSISEAAPIDLVLLFDTSESMGRQTPGYIPGDFDPTGCNSSNTCQPLKTAKDAALNLVNTLYDGYDRVAIVTFNQVAVTRWQLDSSMDNVRAAIGAIPLHDDAPAAKLFSPWFNGGNAGRYNPVNPEDRDGVGTDANPDVDNAVSTVCTPATVDRLNVPLPVGYWIDWDWKGTIPTANYSSGIPCDKPDQNDAFDWGPGATGVQDGMIDASDVAKTNAWINDPAHMYCKTVAADGTCAVSVTLPMSILSTCTGCGIRVATANLVGSGRSNAVWVMVMLSDGVANLSDTPITFPEADGVGIPASYKNGFCGGSINGALWNSACVKQDSPARWCVNPAVFPVLPGENCPPGSSYVNVLPVSPPYSPEDYARDMTDRAALLHSPNLKESLGSDMAIYTIGLGTAAAGGEALMRYMADVGDDGVRNNSSICTINTASYKECGQYYFTLDANKLGPIFDSIASRIYTKITY